MAAWVWVVIALVTTIFVFDWLLVMGINPRNWKGGGEWKTNDRGGGKPPHFYPENRA